MNALEATLERVDAIADRAFAGWHVPGLAYGVVLDGKLVHRRGIGTLRVGEVALPDAGSVFRIASMTKSFTAATVLALRDEGRLRLDDPIAEHVPELASLHPPSTDSSPVTIRHLLTMTAGFPTDDPWGDRQQDLDLGAFLELLRGGLSFAWAPGTRFEYSNTGYGILGRLITNVAGAEYRDVVRGRLLDPLGMLSTGFTADEFEPARLAAGYLWRNGSYEEQPVDGYGALASMGGLFTTVEDLVRWVGGFMDAFPPRDDPEGPHPLRRATRREMQQPMVPADGGIRVSQASADALPDVESLHYGFGLFQADGLQFGRIVGHGGGYPGFGSHMRWHPASGLGVITLANARYAPAGPLARELLTELLRSDAAPMRRTRASSAAIRARADVERLIRAWDDGLARRIFAMNVELDEPLDLRKAELERIRERHGALRADDRVAPESATSFQLAWWLVGERGRVRVDIQLSPELPPLIQNLSLTSVPEPPAALQGAAVRIVEALRGDGDGLAPIAWPIDVEVTAAVDLRAVRRALRATEARFAPLVLGPSIDGDGERKATFRLDGPAGRVELRLESESVDGRLSSVALVPVLLTPPALD